MAGNDMSLPPMINSSRLPLEILVVLHQHLTIARVTAAPSELFETEIKIVIQSNIKIVVVKFTNFRCAGCVVLERLVGQVLRHPVRWELCVLTTVRVGHKHAQAWSRAVQAAGAR